MVWNYLTLPPKTVALATRVFRVVVFPILLNAISLPDGERPASNCTPKAKLNVKDSYLVQDIGYEALFRSR